MSWALDTYPKIRDFPRLCLYLALGCLAMGSLLIKLRKGFIQRVFQLV